MVSRFLATLSLAPFPYLVNGVGEALWPSRIWRSLWILNSLFCADLIDTWRFETKHRYWEERDQLEYQIHLDLFIEDGVFYA